MLASPGASVDSPVNVVFLGGGLVELTSTDVVGFLRLVVRSIGEARVGFKAESVGTHSIRSSTAMALFLARVDPVVIMFLGRWRSDAFLRYIREQVLECLTGVSFCMANQKDFFTVAHSISRTNMVQLRAQLHHADTVRESTVPASSIHGPRRATPGPATQPCFAVWT